MLTAQKLILPMVTCQVNNLAFVGNLCTNSGMWGILTCGEIGIIDLPCGGLL